MNVLELCAGIGGMSLGLERAGFRVVGQVEIDPFCQRVLARHWPEVPRHDDVRTAVEWWRSEPRPPVDLIAAGFPCQPHSTAGQRRGVDDERWLGEDVCSVVDALRPGRVLIENVPGLLGTGADVVLDRLDRAGYRTRPGVASACAMGAPHPRERLFILAHSPSARWRAPIDAERRSGATPLGRGQALPGGRGEPRRRSWWAVEPRMGRVAYGVPHRVDRLRRLGNAVVPQVSEHIGRLILDGTS